MCVVAKIRVNISLDRAAWDQFRKECPRAMSASTRIGKWIEQFLAKVARAKARKKAA